MSQLIGIDIKNINCIFFNDRYRSFKVPANITKSKIKRPNKPQQLKDN